MASYEDALILAVKVHAGQTRWNGDPYVTHPIRVALRAAEPMFGKFTAEMIETVKIVSALHDTVEDTAVTLSQIEDEFGSKIAEAVNLLSRPDSMAYADFIERLAASRCEIAIRVKISDLQDNLADLRPDHGLRKRYEPALERLTAVLKG